MANTTAQGRLKLTFEQANAACLTFLPIGDCLFGIMDQLRLARFSAWRPYHEFIESLAETAKHKDIHRKCLVEFAKQRLGQPRPFRFSEEQHKKIYTSPYIERLREERDAANGVAERELSTRYPGEIWRGAVDPCEQKNVYLRIKERATYEARWASMIEEQRHRLDEEVAVHATELSRAHTFDKGGRYALFTDAMTRDAAPLGFHVDKARSRRGYPVFSKQIGPDWDLCWSIEEPKDFFWSPFEGLFAPDLTIRSAKLRGSLSRAEVGEFLIIRYQHVIPGFGNAYWKFFSLDELETMIKAHLCIYSLMASVIEAGLQTVLGDTAA